jgi:predicted metal-dependent hydrolase
MSRTVSQEWVPLEDVIPKDLFKAEVQTWASRIGVQVRELHVRPMKCKWGSCSTAGRVSFSTDLLTQSPAFRAEVIVHELLHLKVPNHGRVFNALLKTYLARYG